MMRRLPLLLLLILLGGCATIEDFMATMRGSGAGQEVVPLEARPVGEPISRNYFLLESPQQSVVGEPQLVLVRSQDTLSDLAREYGLGYDELIHANPDVDPWLPGEGTPVLLPTQYVLPDVTREGVILNIASKRLFYFPPVADGEAQAVMTYPIGIGRVGWETPLGTTTVIAKATDPTWYVPLSVRQEHAELGDPLPSVVPPGPDNPLGSHVLKLDMPGYLIHGTNQPYGVGMRVSHGCVRLYPENIELLYSLVELGEPVTIVNEPFLLGQRDGEFYFEGHQPLEDDVVDTAERIDKLVQHSLESPHGKLTKKDADHLRAIASISNGVPVRLGAYDADEVFARARLVRNTVEIDPDAPTLSEVREMMDRESMDDVLAEETDGLPIEAEKL